MFELAKDHFEKVLSTNSHKYVIEKGIICPTNDKYGEKKNMLKAAFRIDMIKLGLVSSQVDHWITVDDWEAKQSEWVPTLVSLNHQQERVDHEYKDKPTKSKPVIKLLCGADLIQTFAKPGLWKDEDIDSIVSKFGLIVISRIGSNPVKFIHEHKILYKHRNNIELVNEPIPNEISSTLIRQQVKDGKSIKYFVPDQVINYIKQNQLYK